MAYAVVRTDLMTGTDVRADLRSVRYMGADGNTPTAIENGHVVKLSALMAGERELWKGVDVAATDALNDVVLIATPEVMYDERKKNLDDFINEKDRDCRGYVLHSRDIFSVTAEALDAAATPEVGNLVELAAGTKLKVVATATDKSTQVGKVIDINKVGRYTYYVIQVA